MGKKMKSNSMAGSTDPCNHNHSPNLDRIIARIRHPSAAAVPRCDDCRIVDPTKKRGGGSRSNHNSQHHPTSSHPDLIWVCLDCNRCHCGGGGSEPHAHARRHAKIKRHPRALRLDSPTACWCFDCDSMLLIDLNQPPGNGGAAAATAAAMSGGYIVRGLANLGNTCFFNSVLQNLLAMDVLRGYIASVAAAGPLTLALKELFVEAACGDFKGVMDPAVLFGCVVAEAAQFGGYQQQDSHELLRYLLDCLHSEEKIARRTCFLSDGCDKGGSSSGATLVDAVFGGQLLSAVACMECGHTSVVYEPFLDLSLPVPSKKMPPKKVSAAKRNNPPSRNVKKRRKVRENGTGKGVVDMQKGESSGSPLDCSQSCVPSPEQKETVATGADENFTGMDFAGPSAMIDTVDSVSQNCEVLVPQSSESRQVYNGENYVECTSNLQISARPAEQLTSSDSCGASFCRDENPSSCTQDSGVILVPPKDFNSVVEEISGVNQNQEVKVSVGSLVKESCGQTTSVAGSERAEVDFDGFGDLFNEPEVTSDAKTETGMGERMDRTLRVGNSSESNQDEVDNTSAPVSLDSCLALFTKPELLSNEHAWHCEYCSENYLYQTTEHRTGERQAAAMLYQSEALKSPADEGEVRSERPSRSLKVDFTESAEFKISSNRNMITNTDELVLRLEGFHNQNVDVDVSQNPLDPIRGSSIITGKYVQDGENNSLELSPLLNDEAHRHSVLKKDEFSESDNNSQYLSCPSTHEATLLQVNSGQHDNDSCSTNDGSSIGCDKQDLAAVPGGLRDQTETIPQSSCENDNFSEVNQPGKEIPQLLDKVHLANGSEGVEMEIESRKIKRDATKRILIDRVPPILTIHLKRFRQDARGRLNKLRGYVSFDEVLDLRPYMDPRSGEKEKCCYRLVGLVEHSGTMTRGHYVAYIRGERSRGKAEKGSNPAWFYASDSHVREISLSEVLRSEAYILFYERICG